MATILVTGATGFIGAHLVRLLHRSGHQVRCLVRKNSKLDRIQPYVAQTIVGDLDDPDSILTALNQVDIVYHLAGRTTAFSQAEFDAVNVDGTLNLVQGCSLQEQPPRLIHVSSLAAAGPSVKDQPRTESQPAAPVSNYGKSKLRGERELYAFAKQVPISIVRPPIVLGEGDANGFLMFESIAKQGLHAAPAGGKDQFSVIAARDLAEALVAVADRGEVINSDPEDDQGVYFVSDPEIPSYAQLGQMIGIATGKKRVRVLYVAKFALWGLAAFFETWGRLVRRMPIMNFDKAREATAGSWSCSAEKLKRETGFQPTTSLQQRLNETAQWYFDQQWLKAPKRRQTTMPARPVPQHKQYASKKYAHKQYSPKQYTPG